MGEDENLVEIAFFFKFEKILLHNNIYNIDKYIHPKAKITSLCDLLFKRKIVKARLLRVLNCLYGSRDSEASHSTFPQSVI